MTRLTGDRAENKEKQESPREEARVERLLRLSADWEPERPAPTSFALRALLQAEPEQKRRRPRRSLPWWSLGSVGAGALAALLVIAIRIDHPETAQVPSLQAVTQRAEPQTVPMLPTEKTTTAPDVAPKHKQKIEEQDHATPVLEHSFVTASSPLHHHPFPSRGVSRDRSSPVATAQDSSDVLPATGDEVADTTVPENAVALDDDAGTIVVPVVVAENKPDGSGVLMTPGVITLPTNAAPVTENVTTEE